MTWSNRPLCVAPTCFSRGYHSEDCPGDCAGCVPRLALDGLLLCRWHVEGIAKDARQAAELYGELSLSLAGSGGPGEKTSGTPNRGLAINERAVEARTTIRHTLVSWAQLVAEARGFAQPPDTIASIAAFVARNAQWLAAQDFAAEATDELRQLVTRAYPIAYPTGARVFDVAPCPMHDCAGTIKAIVRRVDSLLPSSLVCSESEDHTWPADQWLRLGRQLRGRAA